MAQVQIPMATIHEAAQSALQDICRMSTDNRETDATAARRLCGVWGVVSALEHDPAVNDTGKVGDANLAYRVHREIMTHTNSDRPLEASGATAMGNALMTTPGVVESGFGTVWTYLCERREKGARKT